MKQTVKILIVGLLVICTALTFMAYTASASNTDITSEGNFVTSVGYETYKGGLINYYMFDENDSVLTTITPTTYDSTYWYLQDSEFIINFDHATTKTYTIGGDEYTFFWLYEPSIELDDEIKFMYEDFYAQLNLGVPYESNSSFVYARMLIYKNDMPYTTMRTYMTSSYDTGNMSAVEYLGKYQFISYKDSSNNIAIELVPLCCTYKYKSDEQMYYRKEYKMGWLNYNGLVGPLNPCNIQYEFSQFGTNGLTETQEKQSNEYFRLIFTSDEIYKSDDNLSGGGSTGAEISLASKMTCPYDDFNRVNYTHFSVDTTGMHVIKCTCRYCGYSWYCSLTANQWNELLEKTATSEDELSDEKPYYMVSGASIGDGSVSGGFVDIINGTEDVKGVLGKIAYVFQMIYCMLPTDVVTIIDWGVGMLVLVGIAKAIFG